MQCVDPNPFIDLARRRLKGRGACGKLLPLPTCSRHSTIIIIIITIVIKIVIKITIMMMVMIMRMRIERVASDFRK